MHSRRNFLKYCAQGLALAALGPSLTWEKAMATPAAAGDPILVVLHLTGGNDALNTLVPYRDPLYKKARPNLALPERNLLTLEDGWGLHPSLAQLRQLYDEGRLAFINSVGRPDHDRSHFRSSDLWHTAGAVSEDQGWLGRLADQDTLTSVSIGDTLARALFAKEQRALAFNGEGFPEFPGSDKLHASVRRMYARVEERHQVQRSLKKAAGHLEEVMVDYRRRTQEVKLGHYFADNQAGKRLELAARLLAAGLPPRLLHVSCGQFDTHDEQLGQHQRQLHEVDQALGSFWKVMQDYGLDKRVVVMGYSEFGRRVEENATGGTDHGAGGLAFLLGGSVQGGIFGDKPDLSKLRDGDLPHTVDYRSLYATTLAGHLGKPAAEAVVPDHRPIEGVFA